MKQAPGGAGNPVPAVLPGATQQPPCLRLKKTYLKWEIPREVASKLDDAKWRHWYLKG